jgi:hypothetical protein
VRDIGNILLQGGGSTLPVIGCDEKAVASYWATLCTVLITPLLRSLTRSTVPVAVSTSEM